MSQTTDSFYDFNKYGVLKPGLFLFFLILFLTRNFWLSIGVLMSRSPELMGNVLDHAELVFAIAEAPALLVALAMVFRNPDAGIWARVIWRHGRWLLILTSVLTMVMMLGGQKFEFSLSRLDVSEWGMISATTIGWVYLVFAERPRRVFAEFPSKTESGVK